MSGTSAHLEELKNVQECLRNGLERPYQTVSHVHHDVDRAFETVICCVHDVDVDAAQALQLVDLTQRN